MSALGNLTNIRTVIFEHTNRGLDNYNMGKDLIKKGNMGDYKVQIKVQTHLNEIGDAIEVLSNLKNDQAADMALTNLKEKETKLQKKFYNAKSNFFSLPYLAKILNNTNVDKIEVEAAEEIVETVMKTYKANATSKTTKLSLEILSKLSQIAPKEANNNTVSFKIENPKAEEGSKGDISKQTTKLHVGFGEDLFDDNFGDNNNSLEFSPPAKLENPMEQINQALKLVINAKTEDYNEALKKFSKTINDSSELLTTENYPNFEHILHGLVYNTFLKAGMPTNDVDGKPFGQHAFDVGLVPSDMLQECCKKALTIVYLGVLDKILSSAPKDLDRGINPEIAIADLMPELEALDLDTAHKIYGETWNHATKEERNQPNSDFGKEAFRSLNNVKVSLDTKIKAVKTVLDIRKKEYGIK